MRLTGYELYKVWSRRGFIILVAALIISNVFLLWYINRPSDDCYSLSEYGKLNNYIDKLSESERTDYLENLHDEYSDEDDISYGSAPGYMEYEPEYTDNSYSEKVLIDDFYNEWKQISNYSGFLSEVGSNSDILSSISIFANSSDKESDSFSEKNIEKTKLDYSSMSDIQPQFYGGKGVEGIFSFDITEYLLVLNIIVIVSILFYEEKDKNLYSIIRSVSSGRGPLILSKLGALAISTMIITTAFYMTNIVFFGLTAGIGNLNRCIQSVPAYMDTVFRINVGEFLIINILLKTFAYILLGVIVTFISLLLKNSIQIILVFIAVYGSGIVLWNVIERTSGLVLLKYLNIEGVLKTEELIGRYCNANIFGNPIEMWIVEYAIAVTVFVAFTVADILIFCKFINFTTGKSRIIEVVDKIIRIPIPNTLLGHEVYKSGVMYRTIIVFIIYVIVTFNNITGINYYITPAEQYYQSCMKYLEGELTPEKEKWLDKKQQQYDKLFNRLNQIEEMYGNGELSKQEAENLRLPIESKTAFYSTFSRVMQKKEYISKHSESEFVYEKGYYMLLGADYRENLLQLIGIITVLILMLSPVHAMEYKTDMNRLIKTTPLGRSKTRKAKLIYSISTITIVFILMTARNVYIMATNFGLPNCTAGVSSIFNIAAPYGNIPIFAAIFIVYLFVLLLIVGIGLLILLISKKVKNVIYSILISMSMFIVPLTIVYLMNLI